MDFIWCVFVLPNEFNFMASLEAPKIAHEVNLPADSRFIFDHHDPSSLVVYKQSSAQIVA